MIFCNMQMRISIQQLLGFSVVLSCMQVPIVLFEHNGGMETGLHEVVIGCWVSDRPMTNDTNLI